MLTWAERLEFERPAGGDSGASISLTLPGDVAAGNVLIATCVAQASVTDEGSAGEANDHALVDDLGSVWTKAIEWTAVDTDGRLGSAVSVWYLKLAALMPGGTVITCGFGASRQGRILEVSRYTLSDPDGGVAVGGVAGTFGLDDDTPALTTLSGIAAASYTWVGRGGCDAQNSTDGSGFSHVPDVPANWSQAGDPLWNGGNNFAGQMLWAQDRQLAGVSVTWDTGPIARNWVQVIVAFEETAPPEPPPVYPEGWREYEEDFDTPEHMVEDASITHRPDAIIPDPRVASAPGPGAVGNLSQGRESRRWQARVAPGGGAVEVRVSNFTNSDWGPWTTLVAYSGAEIEELTLAFDWTGYPVVAAERRTGAGSSPEIWLSLAGGAFSNLGPGRTPRAVLGNWDGETVICLPSDPEVHLFYLDPGVGLVRRSSGDGFATEFETPIGYLPTRYLHKATLHSDRRLLVWYADHDPVSGTYSHHALTSVRFPERLRRPTFDISDPFAGLNFCWLRGQMYRNPQDTVVESTLAAIVYSHVTGVKLQFQTSAAIPSGYQPPGEGGIWSAIQESPVLTGTTQWTFTFPVSHGAGTSSVRALRCRAVLGEDSSCVSGWAYWVAVPEWPFADIIYEDVNCFRDAVICTPRIEGLLFEVAGFDAGCHPCDAEPVCEAACGPGFDGYFFGGVENIGGYTRNWGVRLRAAETGTRTWWDDWLGPEGDPLEPRFVGGLVSRPFTSWTSGAGGVFETSGDQWPLQWPPGGY